MTNHIQPAAALRLVSNAEHETRAWLAERKAWFSDQATSIRANIASLRQKGQYDPVSWQREYNEIDAAYGQLRAAWQAFQKTELPQMAQRRDEILAGLEAYRTADFEQRFAAEAAQLPHEAAHLFDEYQALKDAFAPEKIVFVDIDGVLSSFRSWAAVRNAPLMRLPASSRIVELELDAGSVGLLTRLCEHADAKLVLTSSWRKIWPADLTALHARLIEQGLRQDLWHKDWHLPVLAASAKWQEIAAWRGWAPKTVALIIDNGLPPGDAPTSLRKQAALLRTDEYEGFGVYNYFDALDFFGVEDKDRKAPDDAPPRRGVQSSSAMTLRP